MLKQFRRYQCRLAWVSLAGILLFAMGPFALVPMTAWAGSPCHEAPVAVANAGHHPVGDHPADGHHAHDGANDQQSKGTCSSDHCPPIDTNCCGAPSCGLTAILPHFGLPFYSADQSPIPACRQSAGSFIAISLPRPPAA